LEQHILLTSNGLDMQMIGQYLKTPDEKAQEPLETHTHRTTNATQRNPLHQQAFNQRSGVLRDESLLKSYDKLAPTVLASMVLFAVVDVTIFLIPG
jgi:hypothetical protein